MEQHYEVPWYYDSKTLNDNELNLKNQIKLYMASHNLYIEDEMVSDIINNLYHGDDFKTPSPKKRNGDENECPNAPKKGKKLKF